MKISIMYYVVSILGIVALSYYILHTTYYIPPAFAQQTCLPSQSPNPRVTSGLISTPGFSDNNRFGNDTGRCVVDPGKAPFAPFKIPSFADLKSLYFDQAKTKSGVVTKEDPVTANPATDNDIKLNSSPAHLYYVTHDLNIDTNIPGGQSGIIFVEGNLNITSNINTNDSDGLVFVVKGNVNISPSVTRVDAIIISQGIIYTAGASCATSSVNKLSDGTTSISPLTINGSLISLNQDIAVPIPIKFCRSLGTNNNTQAAEIINQQPKYLVILKDLLSDTLQKWSEIQ